MPKPLPHGLLYLLAFCAVYGPSFSSGAVVGFNYGSELSVVPPVVQLVNLLKLQHITSIRLFEANTTILQALAGTGIQVTLTIPNTEILSIGASNATAVNWVRNYVLGYLPNTNITGIVVGNEILTTLPNAAPVLLPAMENLHSALVAAKLDKQIKISTPLSTTLILDSFPPSQAFFNKTWNNILQPMFSFLFQTESYLMLNVYPYDTYKDSDGVIALDYALMNPLDQGSVVVDSNTLLQYTSLLDAVLDSAYFALTQLNFSNLPIVVSATGWPSQGDDSDKDAIPGNAAAYNSNLIRHIVNNTGTPKHPRTAINIFVLELFNEDLKAGPTTIKHYGLFNSSNMSPMYLLSLTGSGPLLVNDTTNALYCVAKPGADDETLQIALDWACGVGHANCTAIQPGMLCYEPDTVANHASYAFNNYYQRNGRSAASCTFNGAAIVTTTNPSYGVCNYSGSSSPAPTAVSSANITSSNNATFNANVTTNSTSGTDNTKLSISHVLYTLVAALTIVMAMGSRM